MHVITRCLRRSRHRPLALAIGVLLMGLAAPASSSAAGPLTWTGFELPSPNMWAVSCPSASLCVATATGGEVLVSTDPAGGAGAWTAAKVSSVDGYGVSCPSASLCVAGGENGVVVSTNPTGGAGAWSAISVPGAGKIRSISCPSASLCVAGSDEGVVTSTNPTGGSGAWTVTDLAANNLWGMSCTGVSLCVGVGIFGELATSVNPTGGAGAWTLAHVPGNPAMWSVSCPSPSLCVAGSEIGAMLWSTEPVAGGSSWRETAGPGSSSVGVSCPSISLCVSVGGDLISTDPVGGQGAWVPWTWSTSSSGPAELFAVSCPSTQLCVAAGPDSIAVGAPGAATPPSNGSAAPQVTITKHPPAETPEQTATFSFKGVPGGSYECSIDDGAWAPCHSGQSFGPLMPGDHRFQVREKLNGITGPAASYRWTIDLPRACILKVARARVSALAQRGKVRLVIHYKAYKPAQVTVAYALTGGKGNLGLGTASSHFKTAGIYRRGERLDKGSVAKLRATQSMTVRFSIPQAPSSCTRYYTKRLTIPQHPSPGLTTWFQSDSIFGPEAR